MNLLSSEQGLNVRLDLRKVTPKEPLGFTLALSPVGDHGTLVTRLVNTGIIFDKQVGASESLDGEHVMTLRSPVKNAPGARNELISPAFFSFAHKNPDQVEFLKNTSFWLLKLNSRRA